MSKAAKIFALSVFLASGTAGLIIDSIQTKAVANRKEDPNCVLDRTRWCCPSNPLFNCACFAPC